MKKIASIRRLFDLGEIPFNKRERLSQFAKYFQLGIDFLGLFAIAYYFWKFIPPEAFTSGPATGGDTASHFWPLVTLVREGIPHLSLRIWNPGNLGGEPHLVHYFPFPFLLMAALSLFTSLGAAFNIGTLLPLFLLPFSVYFCLKMMRCRFPGPILGAFFSLFFIYNESYSMFGGNALSTMAGQFSHEYALNLILIGTGLLVYEIRNDIFPYFSGLTFAFLICSHAYVALIAPVMYVSTIFLLRRQDQKRIFKICLISGVISLGLSIWYLIPMIDNAPWTTAHPETWDSSNLKNEIAPSIFYAPLIASGIAFLVLLFLKRSQSRLKTLLSQFGFWVLPTIVYVGLFFIFPKLGVVDVRAVPQIQLFLMILSAIIFASMIDRAFGKIIGAILVVPCLVASLWWADTHVKQFPTWIKWNYSGWESKPLSPVVKPMMEFLSGDLSQPRVVYEHNDITNGTGTLRLFEMLPYFANRATTESLYLQATILAPMVYDLQAEVSKTPSCPYWRNYKCEHYNFHDAVSHMRLLGVQDMALITPEVRSQASESNEVKATNSFGPFHLYTFKTPTSMAEVPKFPFKIIPKEGWKQAFFDWYRGYPENYNFELVDRGLTAEEKERFTNPKNFQDNEGSNTDCKTDLAVDFTGIILGTSCPGRPHILKFAYHPTFRADTDDKIYLVSPGFIMLTPSKSRVYLQFGRSLLWQWASTFSALAFLVFIFLIIRKGSVKVK